MSNNLRTDFIQAEDALLSLLSEDPMNSLDDFSEIWTALANRLSLVGPEIDEETLIVAHRVSSRIEFIAKQILELHEKADAYSLALQNDLNELVAKVSLADEDISPHVQNPPRTHLPSLIRPAYAWLLHNLHNPYPPKETKCRISRVAGSSLKDVENWFANVRKRIGWNRLRMQQFSNQRSLIVDAATRFFLPNPILTSTSLPLCGYEADFMAIKINAETLYPQEHPPRDEFPEVLATVRKASTGRASSERLHAKRRARAALAYPSPERSPEPHFLDNTNTLKRRQSFDESSSDSDLCPPRKRNRIVEVNPQVFLGLPSPASSLPELSGDSDTLPDSPSLESTLPLCVTSASPLSKKRKRSVSLEETPSPSKRTCPALDLSSNPQPSVHCLPREDEFPNELFNPDLPPAITTVDLASLDPLEVNIYEWNTWSAAALGQISPPSPQTNALPLGRNMKYDDVFFQTGTIPEFPYPLDSLSSHSSLNFLPSSDLSFLGLYQHSDDPPFGVSISDTDWLQSSFSLTSQPLPLPCTSSTDELANCNWNFDSQFSIDVTTNVSKHRRMQLLRDELVRLEATP